MNIENYKVKYITEKEATELWEDMHFCPAYGYRPFLNLGLVLYDGEIGSMFGTRYVIKK